MSEELKKILDELCKEDTTTELIDTSNLTKEDLDVFGKMITALMRLQSFKYNDTNKKEKKLQKLKKKYTRTIKKDNNHIYCEVRNYKKLHNELEKMKGE